MSDLKHDLNAPEASQAAPVLGYGPMDSIHAEFDGLLKQATSPGEKNWPALLAKIDAHLREHFAVEDKWMTETAFPPRDCHIDEHSAVLKSSREVLALAIQGNANAAPSFGAELARWFPGHADHLDSALAAWMCKLQFGGKPVVLHRQQRINGP